MMKKIISLIVASAAALSLVLISVCAVGIEATAPTSESTIETTVAPTISEDYIPSGTPHKYNIIIDTREKELKEHLILCEHEKPKNKVEAQNNQDAVREYIAMIFDLLPEAYESDYVKYYLMAQPSIDAAYKVYYQYENDINTFEEQEKIEAQKRAEQEAKKKAEQEAKKQQSQNKNKGKFKLTAYCNCKKCCGKWAGGPTASGKMPKQGRTIAVDPKVIPLGSKVIINGKTYIAEDTGSAIKGNRIDVYFDSHSEALKFGVQYANVHVVKD